MQNLYILNMHRLVRSVLLPGEEVLGDGVQDVGAEHLGQRSFWCNFSFLLGNSQYLVLENLFCNGVCPFYNWNVHVDDLELVWPEEKR